MTTILCSPQCVNVDRKIIYLDICQKAPLSIFKGRHQNFWHILQVSDLFLDSMNRVITRSEVPCWFEERFDVNYKRQRQFVDFLAFH